MCGEAAQRSNVDSLLDSGQISPEWIRAGIPVSNPRPCMTGCCSVTAVLDAIVKSKQVLNFAHKLNLVARL
jgi:hypothetical protein